MITFTYNSTQYTINPDEDGLYGVYGIRGMTGMPEHKKVSKFLERGNNAGLEGIILKRKKNYFEQEATLRYLEWAGCENISTTGSMECKEFKTLHSAIVYYFSKCHPELLRWNIKF